MTGEVEGGLDAQRLQTGCIASPDAPDLFNLVLFEGLDASFIGIDEATMIKALVFLGIVAGHLCQCLCGGNADADRHTGGLPDVCRQVFSPFLQVVVIHARQVAEAFIDAVTIEGWSSLAD